MHCQRCRLPLAVHKSLSNLTANQNQNLLFKYDPHSFSQPVGSSNTNLGEGTIFGNADDASFINLTEDANPLYRPVDPDGAQSEAEKLEKLLDHISGATGIDLPLCQDCAESVRAALKSEYEEVCQERDAYIKLLNKIKNEPAAGSSEVGQLLASIKTLETECEQSGKLLEQAEQSKLHAEHKLELAKKQHFQAELIGKQAFADRNNLESKLRRSAVETRRLEALAEYQRAQLHKLQKTNVYNDVFLINYDGNFGTINGLRLGRLKDKKVDWTEINAAWGQTLLLVSTVIAKLGIKIPEYRLRPLGSMSRIEKLEINQHTNEVITSTTLELFSSGDYSFERLLYHKRLDSAMVAFLDVLDKVGKFVETREPAVKLPYAISDDKIGGCSIKLSLNSSNETWTTACKYVLTNAKWILAYMISECQRQPTTDQQSSNQPTTND